MEIRPVGGGVVPCGRTDRGTDIRKEIDFFAILRKRLNLWSIISKTPLNIFLFFSFLKITSPNWLPWHVMEFCNRERRITVPAQGHTTFPRLRGTYSS